MDYIINGYIYPFIEEAVLREWLPLLSNGLNFSYGMTEAGGLIPLDDQRIVSIEKANGVGAVMVITTIDESGTFNTDTIHSVLSDDAASQRLVEEIVVTVREGGLEGVDFDIEYIRPEDRVAYSELISRTASRLRPEGAIVTAALAPKNSSTQKGILYEGHDYRLVGEAADLVLLMTYEWGYTYGPPMAVAPINQVRQVLEYGITEIPREKILMGLPNYGYDWKLPFVQGVTAAEKITNPEAVRRAQANQVEIQFDTVAQSPHYTYYDRDGAEHEVWFEDGRSYEAKMNLLLELGLRGVGIWNVMSSFPEGIRVLEESLG